MDIQCKFCAKYFPFRDRKIYCSYECSRQSQLNKLRQKRIDSRKQKDWHNVIKKCFVCDKEFKLISPNQSNCSKQCSKASVDFDYIKHNLSKYHNKNTPQISWLKLRVSVFDRDKFSCKYCGRSPMVETGVVLHIDHKIPKSSNGEIDDIDNLITACQQCNLGKADLILSIWKDKKSKKIKGNKGVLEA